LLVSTNGWKNPESTLRDPLEHGNTEAKQRDVDLIFCKKYQADIPTGNGLVNYGPIFPSGTALLFLVPSCFGDSHSDLQV
jgi:hypothetical protein